MSNVGPKSSDLVPFLFEKLGGGPKDARDGPNVDPCGEIIVSTEELKEWRANPWQLAHIRFNSVLLSTNTAVIPRQVSNPQSLAFKTPIQYGTPRRGY